MTNGRGYQDRYPRLKQTIFFVSAIIYFFIDSNKIVFLQITVLLKPHKITIKDDMNQALETLIYQ